MRSTATVVIRVLDANDNRPKFTDKLFHVKLPEQRKRAGKREVCRMVARDDDEGSNAVVTYKLQDNKDERFEIDPLTGVVTSHGDFWPGNYSILTVGVQNSFQTHAKEQKTCLLSFSDSNNEFAELCFICRRCGDFKVLTEPISSAKEAKLPVLITLKGTSLTPALEPLSVLPPCHHSALWKPRRLISSRKPPWDFKNIKKPYFFSPLFPFTYRTVIRSLFLLKVSYFQYTPISSNIQTVCLMLWGPSTTTPKDAVTPRGMGLSCSVTGAQRLLGRSVGTINRTASQVFCPKFA